MIETETLRLENKQRKACKDYQSYDFLNNFELKKCERASIIDEANFVGWNLKNIFKKGNSPADQSN